MKKTLATTVAAIGLTAALAAPAAAATQESPAAPTLTTVESDGITWVELSVPAAESSGIQIKIFKVRKGPDRLWQRCNFSGSSAGTYRCGIDSSEGSLAASQSGGWVAKAFISGTRVARTAFTL